MTSAATTPRRSPRAPLLAVAVATTVCALLWLAPSTASATVMEYASPAELVELSDVVVRADVVGQHSFVDDEQGRIVTHTTLAVRETYHGEAGSEVTVEQWGGTVGERTSSVPGDAEFEVGEEVIVFLRRDASRPDALFLTALAQSKYTVDRTDETAMVARDLSDLVVLSADARHERLEIAGEMHGLEAFESRLREMIDEKSGSDR